jgi:hypothetical protein
MKIIITLLLAFFVSLNLYADESYFDSSTKSVICLEKLPIFTLGENSRPTQKEVSTLCSCIWNEFPEGGWEQRTSIKIRDGIDPGWRGKGLISRFGKAVEECGGYGL